MANLVVCAACDLKCAHCFAGDYMRARQAGAGPQPFISLAAFEARLDFVERSGVSEIRLIGGEPTLHPRFPELIERARRRGRHIVVFSHGLLSVRALDCLASLSPDEITVLVNMNATRRAGGPDEAELAQRRETLRRLGPRALLGFTLTTPAARLDFLAALAVEMNCRRSIRLGMAQPAVLGSNLYLHPKQYPLVARRIARFAQTAAEAGLRLELDCGFVRCMFSDEDLESLRQARADFGWRCNPVLDLGLEGQAFHCFPLAGRFQVALGGAAQAGELRAALAEQTRAYRAAGVYRECSACRFKQAGECPGGCLAATLRRFREASFRVTLPAPALPLVPERIAERCAARHQTSEVFKTSEV